MVWGEVVSNNGYRLAYRATESREGAGILPFMMAVGNWSVKTSGVKGEKGDRLDGSRCDEDH